MEKWARTLLIVRIWLSETSSYIPGVKPKGRHFQSVKELQNKVQTLLQKISNNEFKRCFPNSEKRWLKCIALGGNYIERVKNVES